MEKVYFWSNSKDFSFLSAMYVRPFFVEKKSYRSLEHWYQSHKPKCEKDREKIRRCHSPSEAKRLGSSLVPRADWDQVKESVMWRGICHRYEDPELRAGLLLTDGFELIHYAPWGDTFWGVGKDYVGKNVMGQMLMRLRDEWLGR